MASAPRLWGTVHENCTSGGVTAPPFRALSLYLDGIGVDLVSLKESIDTTTPQGKLFFTISAAFAEFERSMIKARQAEGIAIAKEQGRMTGRPKVDGDRLDTAMAMYQSGEFSVSKIQEITGISRSTIYREVERRGIRR
jgi:DNA invertase Pin-like site-specific DNA recombinase